MAPTRTILQELITAEEAGTRARFGIRSAVRLGRSQQALVVGLDNGNDALKLALIGNDGTLFTLRIPTAYREAEVIRGGEHETSYRLNGSSEYWIGDVALRHDGDDLPIGPTKQRIIDARLRALMAAGLAELLHTAGYEAGDHNLILGFAIPNTEIISLRSEGDEGGEGGEGGEERMGVDPETSATLETYLRGARWAVERTASNGAVEHWNLRLVNVVPQAQTTGTLMAVTKAPNGATVTDVHEMDIIDIGGGDLQLTTVQIKPTYRMITRRLGDGTIRVARALKDKFPRHELNDVAAQEALIQRRLLVSGRPRTIDAEVNEVLDSQGQSIIGTVLPVLRGSRRFVTITGGGVILLHDLLKPRLDADAKVRGEDYELINHGIASVCNAIGVLFAVIFKAATVAVAKRG